MKIGDYVRTKYGISKIISNPNTNKFNIDIFKKDGITLRCVKQKDIIKSSPNIIDLIEVGDIVNDEKIIDIGCLTNGPEEGTKVIDYYIAPNTVYYLKNEDIKSIVTKEQFKNIEYEVK